MLKTARLSAKLLWREVLAGEWLIVFFSLIIVTAAITALRFYTDRLTQGLDQQATQFLGGDLVITSSSPIAANWIEQAKKMQLRTAEVWSYPSVIATKNKFQLVNLRAVSNEYPLLGNRARPNDHSVWLEPRLFSLLSIKQGDYVTIGNAQFRVEKRTDNEIGIFNTGWIIAPQVLMRLENVPETHTVIPGSQVEYRLLITGEQNQLKEFRHWVLPKLIASQRLFDIHDSQFTLYKILERAENFLQLALLACLVLAAVAIALSIQQYVRRHLQHVSLWRSFGAKTREILFIYLSQLFYIGIIAGLVGTIIGYFAQAGFALLFKSIFQFSLPLPAFTPVLLIGFLTSIFLLFAFAYPLISPLTTISPLYLWREEVEVKTESKNFYFILSAMLLSLFFYWLMDFSLFALFFMNALFVCINIVYIISLVLLAGIKRILHIAEGSVRRGLNQLIQLSNSVSLQVTAFTLIFMSIFILFFIKQNLVDHWQQTLPKDTPNYFAINIAPADLPSLELFFRQHAINVRGIYPIIKGRLIEKNGQAILNAIPQSALNNNALRRELNLSWMWQFPSDNKIVAGRQWQSEDQNKAFISIEKGLADNLGFTLGDTLSFQIGADKVSGKIISIRTVDWTSFHPNFFIIFSPGVLNNFPTTYITSFHLEKEKKLLMNQLITLFPNMTIVDVDNIFVEAHDLVNKITLALHYIFIFALLISVLIFISSLQASMDERKQTYRLLRILGANNRYIYRSIVVEFGSLFTIIILMSYGLAQVVTFLLEKTIFNL